MESILLDYFKQYFPAIASMAFGFAVGIAGTDYIKRARRDFNQPRPKNIAVQTYAILIAAAACHSSGIFFFKAPPDESILLSIFCGILCPVIMKWLMNWAKTNRPDLYEALRVKFPADGVDLNASGKF